MDKTELIKKIVTFEDMSQSQIDRINLNNSSYSTVIKFLELVVNKIESGVGLESKLEKSLDLLTDPVDDADPTAERLSPNQVINLYLGILKHKSELSAPIISVLKEAVKVNVINNTSIDGNSNAGLFPTTVQGESYSKEDIQRAKKTLHIANTLGETEFSLDELEELIKEKKNK